MWKIRPEISEKKLNWNFDLFFQAADKFDGTFLFTNDPENSSGKNIIGVNPVVVISENIVQFGKRSEKINPLELIDEIIKINNTNLNYPLFLGYLSYDYKDQLEEKGLFAGLKHGSLPQIHFVIYEYYIITDNKRSNSAEIVKLNFEFKYEQFNLENIFNLEIEKDAGGSSKYIGSSLSRDEFKNGVKKIKEYVKQGDIYQANLTREITGTTDIEPTELASRLSQSNPIEFGVFSKINDSYIISTTPERFFRIENKILTTSPVKGTIERSADPTKDKENLQQLLSSNKDKAELAMIVDLLRNDMHKVCIKGSVFVKDFPIVKKLNNVYHLYSDIEGHLKKVSYEKIFKALFPCGSISGCPKVRSCQIIEELEGIGRGAYTGSFGYINFNGNSDFNILIRTLFYDKGNISFNVGGGITLLSDPEMEYRETIHKANNIYNAIKMEEIWEERYCLTEK
jgi:para-aminobenzoate synthetase component 1